MPMRVHAVVVTLALFAGGTARPVPGGRVVGHVSVTIDGTPREDASGVVVYVTGFTEPPPRGVVRQIMQRSRQFEPPLLAITAGQEVSFPNGDPFFHNVF